MPNQLEASTEFTSADMADLETHLGLIVERYRRFRTVVEWEMLDFIPTTSFEGGEAYLQGTQGGTIINPLYGEAVPTLAAPEDDPESVSYGSPHENSAVDATIRNRYKPVQSLNIQIRKSPPDDSLTLTNKDGSRSIWFSVPTRTLDLAGITANEGDRFTYRGVAYKVTEAKIPEHGYWRGNTNIPLYVVGWAQVERLGT